MKLGLSISVPQDETATAETFIAGMKLAESVGFDGIWFFDTIGRGRLRPDPLIMASVAATVTDRVDIGTCIYQVPLRQPVELAHRLMTVQAMTGGRFLFGVGAGSTRTDFEAVDRDFENRFRDLREALPLMRRLWAGEEVAGTNLTPWPTVAGGPPILIGSWAGSRWIPRAAQEYDGWIASAHFTNAPTLAEGIERFRGLGGRRALVANVKVDLTAPTTDISGEQGFHLQCAPDEARARLAHLAELGFDYAILVVEDGSEANLRAVRDLWQS